MNTKTLIAGLVGGVASFFLGWALYGIVLDGFMKAHTNQCMVAEMNMLTKVLSCLASGLALAFILSWANVSTLVDGATKGAIAGLLLALSMDFYLHSMTTYFVDMTGMAVDLLAATAMNAAVGGVVGWMLGRNAAAA